MMCEKSKRLRWPDAGEGMLEMVAAQRPDGRRIGLLRSPSHPALEPGGDSHQRLFGLAEMGMYTGQRDGRLTGMFGFAPD